MEALEIVLARGEVSRMLDDSPQLETQASAPSLEDRISHLAAMSLQAVRKEWRSWYKCAPPSGLSRDLLIRAIAYRMQEKSLSGLDPRTRRKLNFLATKLEAEGSIDNGGITLRPGTKLLRTWDGNTYRVSVLPDGYEYDRKIFSSLSEIANTITGAHWSGPRFFGLKKMPSREASR